MSWDEIERKETARCACGKGCVTRIEYSAMNDWNQTREGYRDEKIECKSCSKNYHLEYISGSYYAHRGDEGTYRKDYLVPNGETINPKISYQMPSLKYDEQIVAFFNVNELKDVIADMKKNKYSTRLELDNSKQIVDIYKRHWKKCSIPPIIEFLNDLISNYGNYDWTKEKYNKQKKLSEVEVKKNNDIVKEVLKHSFELKFEYVK